MTRTAYRIAIGFIAFLASLSFVVLKYLNIISKSWWWITVPLALAIFFINLEYDDYFYQLSHEDADNADVQILFTCNKEENAQLISEILEADSNNEIYQAEKPEKKESS